MRRILLALSLAAALVQAEAHAQARPVLPANYADFVETLRYECGPVTVTVKYGYEDAGRSVPVPSRVQEYAANGTPFAYYYLFGLLGDELGTASALQDGEWTVVPMVNESESANADRAVDAAVVKNAGGQALQYLHPCLERDAAFSLPQSEFTAAMDRLLTTLAR